MHALPFMAATLCVLTIAYRYYSAFLAAKVVCLDDNRVTPANELYDGQNYYPTNRWVLFGHHFAAITGAGPLIGPVLAAQFGFMPGFVWILAGVVLAGAVQDFVIMTASVRRKGRSLAQIAAEEISPAAGLTAAVATLFILVVSLAGLGLAVVSALRDSAWGTFTIGCSIPIGFAMGLWMYVWKPGQIRQASIFGVITLLAAVVGGRTVSLSPTLAPYFTLSREQIVLAIAAYGFIASVLPVWLLLCPRDYLSSYMKIGTIASLIVGILVVNPELKFPATTAYVNGGGPIVPGKLFPFVFITIACGAISGFHSLVASGTTPKMIQKETDIRPIGYGAMLMEGLVGITALIAATCLDVGDYFAINTTPAKFSTLGLSAPNLPALAAAVGEHDLTNRTGGAVSLALGMAQVLSGFPGMKHLMGYWYHFAIMFEALFILTTIDTGTRVARFLVQEVLGRIHAPLGRTGSVPAGILATTLVVGGWATLLYNGTVSTIWPMFGISNQLLACVALAVGTTVIINEGRGRYAFVTLCPLLFIATTTLTAGWQTLVSTFKRVQGLPFAQGLEGWANILLIAGMMVMVLFVFFESVRAWMRHRKGTGPDSVPPAASATAP